jgi:uncharacterized protein (TIGR02145 family)
MKSYIQLSIYLLCFSMFAVAQVNPSIGSTKSSTSKNPYVTRIFTDENGKEIEEIIVPGRPPENYRAPVAKLPDPDNENANVLANVPAFDWSFGCSATSAAMIASYYDRTGYDNIYTGPTNGGVMPMNNSYWPAVVINGETRKQCPLSATHQGLDGRPDKGHVDDYWYMYGSEQDPYYGNWTQHEYGDCTADYMGTNQYHNFGVTDGATRFYSYLDGSPLYDYTGCEPYERDGCHGFKLFMESRGYDVQPNGNYSQRIYGYEGNTLGFTYDQFKDEIDAGRPVIIQVTGHSMVGYGYDESGGNQLVYIHDTWDYNDHTMEWGGTYANDMQHYGVVVMMLEPLSPLASYALDFDGVDDFVNCGHDVSLNITETLTVEAWINPSGWGEFESYGYGRIVDKNAIKLFLVNDGGSYYDNHSLVFALKNSESSYAIGSVDNSISLNEWQHVAATYNGNGEAYIYINGVEQEISGTLPTGALMDHSADVLYIGEAVSQTRAFEGLIDEVRIWNVERSETEIQDYMFSYLAGTETGLAGYWQMNEGQGSVINDLSGNNNIGQLGSTTGNDPGDPFWTPTDWPYMLLDADFSATPQSGYAPLTVQFNDESTCNPSSWEWDFENDGTVDSYDQNPQWTYSSPGIFSVSLTVNEGSTNYNRLREDYISVNMNVTGDTIYVKQDGTGNATTVQGGIDLAQNGQVVLVYPGTYNENITFSGKLITVGSLFLTTQDESYISQTTIDGGQADVVVSFAYGEDAGAMLTGFTITNGDSEYGGGIFIYYSSPTLSYLHIVDNSSIRGGGIYCKSATPSISFCLLAGNDAESTGGALNFQDCSGVELDRLTIANNNAQFGGALMITSSSVTIENSILWGNQNMELYFNNYYDPNYLEVNYCDAEGGQTALQQYANNGTFVWGTGNLNANPLFTNAASGDYSLAYGSPCIDTGDPAAPLDPDGTRADIGAIYHVQQIDLNAEFSADVTAGGAPLTVQFTDASEGNPSSWEWDFDNDGTVDSYEQNPEFIYTEVGVYSVSLTVINDFGQDTKTRIEYITVFEPLFAEFTADITSGEAPLTVQFTDESTGDPSSWEWDFENDGTVDATIQHPEFTYSEPGIYSVSLTVINDFGQDTKTRIEYITVLEDIGIISEVSASQRTDGSRMVDVSYNLDGSQTSYPIILEVSFNDGSTYEEVTDVSGDIGTVEPGTGLTITWDAGTEFPAGFYYETVKVRVTAVDEGWECGDLLTDPRDGQQYETVQIGDYCWMARNLAYLPTVSPSSQWSKTEPYYYVYDYQGSDVAEAKATTNYQTYGVLYNWPSANVSCPPVDGWHLPSDEEWKILEGTVDSQYPVGDPEWDDTGYRGFDVGYNLRSTAGWYNNGNGSDLYGFSALPGGMCGYNGEFHSISTNAGWWNSNENSTSTAWFHSLAYNSNQSWRNTNSKNYAFSVRCLKNPDQPDQGHSSAGSRNFSGESPAFIMDTKNPEVTLSTPNGGGIYSYLEMLNISWTATDDTFEATPVSAGISTEEGGTITWLAGNIANSGSTQVDPPDITTLFAKAHLKAVDAFGNEGNDASDEYFELVESIIPLDAEFSADVTEGVAPLTVQFTDASEGNPSSWEWDFQNDGTVDSYDQNPAFTYTDPGIYSVSLTVYDGEGSSTETKIDYITVNESLVADFTANVTSGDAPLTVQFNDLSTGNPSSWEWDFENDGTVDSYLQNPEFVYTNPGSYSVRLKVSKNSQEDVKIQIDYILVEEPFVCPSPTNLTADNITYHSAELDWTPGNSGTQWDLLWGLHDFDPLTEGELIEGISVHPYNLDELEELTSYDFYVRTVCDDEVSDWAGPQSFTTLQYLCEPGWTLTPYFQYNMQIIGELYIDGVQSFNPNDKIGAFVDGECRGIAAPDPDLNGLVFLSVGSNSVSGEQVDFIIWKVAECVECPTGESMVFENQLQVGTPGNPYLFQCALYELDLNFGEGYTWFSVNIDPGSMMLNDLFTGLSPCEEDRIIGQNAFAVVYNGSWVGSLTAISPAQMYKMQLCSEQSLTLEGQPAENEPIMLGAGYTWLGYLPQDGMNINTALAGLSPLPDEDSRLIGQNSFAVYYQGQWVGSLTQLQPGDGYIIELSNGSTLTYPSALDGGNIEPVHEMISPTGELPLANLQYNMMLIAQLELPDGSISTNPEDVIYAFSGDECRGMAIPNENPEGKMFMTIGADLQTGEEITFKAWLSEFGILEEINETIAFESLKKAGTMDEPVLLTLKDFTGVELQFAESIFIGEPFPNPFNDQTEISYRLPFSANVKLMVYNSHGQPVAQITEGLRKAGSHKETIKREDLAPGVYYFRMKIISDKFSGQKNGKLIISQ